jgi:hypothetical protein
VATDHRALVLTTSAAGRTATNGASLRVDDVCALLVASGFTLDVVQQRHLLDAPRACLGVAVSYAGAPALRALRALTGPLWLDAVDSWLKVDLSGLRAGHPSYLARLLRDAVLLTTAPTVDLVTYISHADRRADRSSVRGRRRLVLPGTSRPIDPLPQAGTRAVLAGDWSYPPNRDGLGWFVREVLPALERLQPAPSWRIDVYGPHAPALPARLHVHGYSPEEELYRRGDVHLGPIHHGGGVKRKVLQALLAGLPAVTTIAGAHGLRPHPLLHVVPSATAFAEATAAVMNEQRAAIRPRIEDLVDADDRDAIVEWLAEVSLHCQHGFAL